jgi:hypothetical protein
MRRRFSMQAALTAVITVAATAGLAATGLGVAPASAATSTPLPAHVFAPYFEMYDTSSSLSTLSQESGAKFLSLAFLQTAKAGSCTAYWNGDTSTPIAKSSFGSDIAAIQAAGGNVIPSFGGYSADSTGTDIADSCTNVSKIAAVYEKVITNYNVPRIDLDIESDSLTDTAGINRRDAAVAQVESWAKSNGRSIQFSYTMPSTTTGMTSGEQGILQNAVADGAGVSVVNMMTFDYYIGTKQNMLTDTENAAADTISQLETIYPSESSSQLWAMLGVTEMPGIDDYGADETFTKAEASPLLSWAKSNGLSTLTFWALQRDNGGCPGTKGAGTCSGIKQSTWFFSHHWEPFTS